MKETNMSGVALEVNTSVGGFEAKRNPLESTRLSNGDQLQDSGADSEVLKANDASTGSVQEVVVVRRRPKRDRKSKEVRINTGEVGPVPSGERSTDFSKDAGDEARLESRDNPFIPGGELSKETDDLLKRATIIRDKFYLDEFGNMVPCDGPDSPGRTGETFDTNDKHCVEENMSAEVANSAQASPKPRVNGKLDGSASPDAVKVDMKEQADGNASADDSQKDKKKQKKCCSVM